MREYVPVTRSKPIGKDAIDPVERDEENEIIESIVETEEELTVKRWNEVIFLLKGLEEQWSSHLEGLNWLGTTDFLPEDLQRHLAQIFTHAEFYTALPQLVDYIRAVGGIDNLFVKEAKEGNGRTD